MSPRKVARILPAQELPEGQGVTVYRTIGTPALSQLDPFLLLDEFVIAGDAKGAGFPDHPHRGFETVTYMLSGRMEHRDTAGNSGVIGPGAAQWMTAGRGLVHSEMPASDGEEIRGLQLWVNLAAADKMKTPAYQDIAATDIPEAPLPGGGNLRIIAGKLAQGEGPMEGPVTGIALAPLYVDITLAPQEALELPLEPEHTAFAYLLSGELLFEDDDSLTPHALAEFGTGECIRLQAGTDGARLALIAAKPLGEAVARYGPFVMNTRSEIEQAIQDFQQGRMG
jgi:redox-sensitive bicupin YhaK (pirin superfamily)